jgi:hypothetical protein
MSEPGPKPAIRLTMLLQRFARSALLGAALIAFSLLAGMAGYHYYVEGLPWLDAFSNAAMILSGMGPLAQPQTPGGKVFAGLYALYSGLAVVLITGITFAPLIHAFLYRLHLETKDDEPEA